MPSTPSPPKTTTTTTRSRPAPAPDTRSRRRRPDERHARAGPRRDPPAGPEQAVQHLLDRAPRRAVPGDRAADEELPRLRRPVPGVLHDRDGVDRPVQLRADRQRPAHLLVA